MKQPISIFFAVLALVATAQAQEPQIELTSEFSAAVRRYDIVQSFSSGLAPVCSHGKWGYINAQGQEVIACRVPATYDLFSDHESYGFVRDETYVRDCHDGMVAVPREVSGAKSGYDRHLKWAYFDASGRQVTDYIYDTAGDFAEGLAWVSNDSFHGFIDKAGQHVIDGSKYYSADNGDMSYTFSEGLCNVAAAKLGDDGDQHVLWGYIDTKGQEVVPCRYECAKPFSCGLAAVAVASDDFDALYPVVYSYLHHDGSVAFSMPAGKECGTFSCDLATVTTDGQKFGFIDTTGTFVLSESYVTDDTAMPAVMADFVEGYTLVGSDMTANDGVVTFRLMDAKGGFAPMQVLGPVQQGVALCTQGGKLGFVHADGSAAIPCQYDGVQAGEAGRLDLGKGCYRFGQGVAAVRKSGKWGYVDLSGHDTF